MEAEKVVHPLTPVFDQHSRVLILGTMPSPKSREVGFYYGHPQNRFWPVLAALWAEPVPQTAETRRSFALRHGIALWDVLASCRIAGASDSSIRDAVPNDIAGLLKKAPVQRIFTTGQAAARLYERFCLPQTGVRAITLPSTSPANCRVSLAALTEQYRQLLCGENPAK